MRVSADFRAPDDGEYLVVLAVNEDGDVQHLPILSREWLLHAIEPLRASVEHIEEHGGVKCGVLFARRDFLRALERLRDEWVYQPVPVNDPDEDQP